MQRRAFLAVISAIAAGLTYPVRLLCRGQKQWEARVLVDEAEKGLRAGRSVATKFYDSRGRPASPKSIREGDLVVITTYCRTSEAMYSRVRGDIEWQNTPLEFEQFEWLSYGGSSGIVLMRVKRLPGTTFVRSVGLCGMAASDCGLT